MIGKRINANQRYDFSQSVANGSAQATV